MQIHHPKIQLLFILWLSFLVGSPCWALEQTQAPYEETVKRIIEGFEQGNAEPFNQALDAKAIADKATEMVVTDPDWISRFRPGLIKGIRQGIGTKLLGQMYPGSYVRLLKLDIRKNEARALLRFDYGEQGNGYLNLIMKPSPGGEVRIVDWYDYAMGQPYTSSLRQLVAILAPSPTVLGKLYDVASDRKEVSEALRHLFKLNKEQKHAELAKSFLEQEESVRSSKVLSLSAVHAASFSGDDELYHKALSNLEQFHGEDETLFFILLDYYFIEEKYDHLLSRLDKIKIQLGSRDAALEVIRANTLTARGDYTDALAAANEAVAMEPDYEWAYMSQFSAFIALEDFTGAVKTADILEKRFDYDLTPEALSSVAEYADFVSSKAYREWRASL